MYALIQLRSTADAPRAHHRRQQHPQRAVHDRELGHRRRAAQAGPDHPADLPAGGPGQRGGGVLHLSRWCPNTCCASSRWVASRLVYRFKVQRRREHPGRRRGGAGLQPRELRRRRAADGGAARGRSTSSWTTASSRCRCWAGSSNWPRRFPIASRKEDPNAYARRLRSARPRYLREGDLLAIFPEGGITRDGHLCRNSRAAS